MVQRANKSQSFIKLTLWNQRHLLYHPKHSRLYTDMSNGVLKSACLSAISELPAKTKLETISESSFDNELTTNKWNAYDSDSFLWLMAIQSARGRVPSMADGTVFTLDTPVCLQYWPNLTRMETIPHSQRMASIWIKQPRSCANMAHALNIDIKHVINFFVATNAAGISGLALRAEDNLFAPQQLQTHQQRRLLSSIMLKLKSLV